MNVYINKNAIDGLLISYRMREVLYCILKGMRTKEIAAHLDANTNTTSTYIQRLRKKLRVANNAEIIYMAVATGWVRPALTDQTTIRVFYADV